MEINFIPFYIFIGLIPIGFIAIACYTNRRGKMSKERRAASRMSKAGKSISSWLVNCVGRKSSAAEPTTDVDIEMQDLSIGRYAASSTDAGAAGAPPEPAGSGPPPSGAISIADSTAATVAGPTTRDPAGPYASPVQKPWYELADEDFDDSRDPPPLFTQNGAPVFGRARVSRLQAQEGFEEVSITGGGRRR